MPRDTDIKPVLIRLPVGLYHRLRYVSYKQKIPMTQIVVEALESHLKGIRAR